MYTDVYDNYLRLSLKVKRRFRLPSWELILPILSTDKTNSTGVTKRGMGIWDETTRRRPHHRSEVSSGESLGTDDHQYGNTPGEDIIKTRPVKIGFLKMSLLRRRGNDRTL